MDTNSAPYLKIPTTPFTAIEYPGLVNSIPKALASLGTLPRISTILASPPDSSRAIELSLNPKNVFSHPIQGHVVPTGNILLKIVKRRRKKPRLGDDGDIVEEGVYTIETMGIVGKTVRFRSLADFQHTPPNVMEHPIVKLTNAVRVMNVEEIQAFNFQAPHENFGEDILLPPPVFSRQAVAHLYEYAAVGASVPATTTSATTGQTTTRLVNASRWKGFRTKTIAFDDPLSPTAPDEGQAKPANNNREEFEGAKNEVEELLKVRPMWSRTALVNTLSSGSAKVVSQKQLLPQVSWTFADGPFRDLVIRFGYDPRHDPESRFYQSIVLRNIQNTRSKRSAAAGVIALNPATKVAKEAPSRLSHLFDGTNLYSKVGHFQLCDITNPLLRQLINAPSAVSPTCSYDACGWFHPDHWEQIRVIIRRKFLGILGGFPVKDDDCLDLLEAALMGSTRKKKEVGESETDESEGENSQNGSLAGSDVPSSHKGKEKEKKRAPRRSKHSAAVRAPWEQEKRPKYVKAKVRNSGPAEESAESRAERLRSTIGLQSREASSSVRGDSVGGNAEQEGDQAEGEDELEEGDGDGSD